MIRSITFSLGFFCLFIGYSQTASHLSPFNELISSSPTCGGYVRMKPTYKLPTQFGIQARTIFPTKFIGNPTTSVFGNGFESAISQRASFGFGAMVRTGLSDYVAIETGINFTQRYFDINISVPDVNIAGSQRMTFIEYDVPIKALILVPLKRNFFVNTSIGAAISYRPSDTQVRISENEEHYFSLYGIRNNSVGLNLNASIGCEYRTSNSGTFYIGGSTRVPFQSLFQYAAIYDNSTSSTLLSGNVNGSFLSVDFKYFFPFLRK